MTIPPFEVANHFAEFLRDTEPSDETGLELMAGPRPARRIGQQVHCSSIRHRVA